MTDQQRDLNRRMAERDGLEVGYDHEPPREYWFITKDGKKYTVLDGAFPPDYCGDPRLWGPELVELVKDYRVHFDQHHQLILIGCYPDDLDKRAIQDQRDDLGTAVIAAVLAQEEKK